MKVAVRMPAAEWPKVRLSEVAEQCLGKMLDAKKNKGRQLPYLRNPNVRWFHVDTTDLQTMPFEDHEHERYGLMAGDIVICEGGEAGRAAIWDGRLPHVKFQKAIHRVRPGPKLHNRYFVHRLMADYQSGRLADYYTGATIKHLTGQDLARYEFALPSLPEQRRIAEVLDRSEALRAKRRAALAQLDALTRSIFLDMFGDPATNPKGWSTKPLGNAMAEVYRYPTYYDITYVEEGVPEIRGELLQDDGRIVTDKSRLRYISPHTSARFPRTVLDEGDLVMTVRGTIGKIGLVPSVLAGANITANLIRLALDRRVLNPTFAWHFTQTAFFKGQLANACSSTTILTIKATDLKRLEIPLPPVLLQHDFSHRIAALEKLKAAHSSSLAELDALFASLQHRAFRGEL